MLVTAVVFFIILSILVFVHELGHFLMARFLGVGVLEFGFGLPPRIWGKKVKGTTYSINWLPIGGFVRLAGEDEEPSYAKASEGKGNKHNLKNYFWARSKKERSAILLAGVTMNFLLAVGVTTYLLTAGVMEPKGRVHIEEVLTGSPAEQIGLKAKDLISAVSLQTLSGQTEKKTIGKPADLIDFTKTHAGEPIILYVKRGDLDLSFMVVPRQVYPKGQGPIGVAISNLELTRYSLISAPFAAFRITLSRAFLMLTSLADLIWRLISLRPLTTDVAGPIGIAQVTGQAVKYGLTAVLEFVSILSLNLAVLNIIPFPALDGGRLAFVFLEKILGHKFHPAFERSTHQIGMIILIVLILLISINDILRLARGPT